MEEVNKSNSIAFDWIPTIRIGPFFFGDFIEKYYEKYDLKQIPEEYNEKVGWKVYRKDDSFSVFSEEGRIIAVSCSSDCRHNGMNIIGTSIKVVLDLLKTKPDFVDTEDLVDGPQTIYDFDKLGLQIWVKKDVVDSAICSDGDNNDESES